MVLKSGRKDIFVCPIHTEGEELGSSPTLKPIIKSMFLTNKVARERMDRFQAALNEAAKVNKGTLALDGGSAFTHLLEQVALADLNKERKEGKDPLEVLPSLHRGTINAQVLNLLAVVSQSNMNFVITHQRKELWIEDSRGQHKPSGVYEARENSQVEFGVNMSVQLFTQMVSATHNEPARRVHFGRIELCKDDETLIGEVYESPTWELLTGLME